MAASYPGSIPTLDAIPATLAGPPTHEDVHQQLADELQAVMDTLGADPQGAEMTVVDRLDALPKGRMGSATATSNQGSITTAVDLTGLSVTFTAETGRKYRISAMAQFIGTSAGARADLLIDKAGTTLQIGSVIVATGVGASVSAMVENAPGAGSVTYKLRAQITAGTGTMQAGATFPAVILVEDIGA